VTCSPLDNINRQFRSPAPDMLCLLDFSNVSRWSGFLYVVFVIDAYGRRIVGWRGQPDGACQLRARCAGAGAVRVPASTGLRADPPLGSARKMSRSPIPSLAEAGIKPSVYMAEGINRRGPWRSFEAVELATPEWETGSTTGCSENKTDRIGSILGPTRIH
jgi:putative transposase